MESVSVPRCSECGSVRVYRNGHRTLSDGTDEQRYLCRECGYRFSSGHNVSKSDLVNSGSNQISAILGSAKNLVSPTEIKTVGDAKNISPEAQIVKYLVHLKNNGLRDTTLEARDFQLKRLISLGADLNDSESVKKVIASLDKSESYKLLLCIAYEGFAKSNGITWTRPNYKQGEPLPFCPYETELDALISNCGKKTATLLKLLKETGMRLGEAWQVEWQDFSAQNRTLICKNPEKNSRQRIFNDLTSELCKMLEDMPRNSQYIFTHQELFWKKKTEKAI